MKTQSRIIVFAAVAATACAGAWGCASSPPPELVDARQVYQRAAQSPNAQFVPGHVRDAEQSLARAEKAFDDHGNEERTRDLAHVAKLDAISAMSAAETARALHDKQVALADLEQTKQRRAATVEQQLESTQQKLSQTEQRVESERRARAASDAKTKELLVAIEGLQTKEESRGLVVTVSGSVLFASNKSKLLPTAQRRLESVAKALEQDKRPIRIIGHTDSTGSDELNDRLSKERADAVKDFLAKRISADRITTEGMGEEQPIANNDTPEGRANNRRVEIILEEPRGQTQQNDKEGQPNQSQTPNKSR